MDLKRLREVTRPEHEAAETSMPLMGEDLTVEGYGAVLTRLLPVVLGWESWAARVAPPAFGQMVEERRRSGLLQADLRGLGAGEGLAPSAAFLQRMRDLDGSAEPEAAFAGALYVMEGSTLGGQFVARHVEERFGWAEGERTAYFRGFGAQTGERWREVRDRLQAMPDAWTEWVVEAARVTFRAFGDGMQP